MTATVHRGDSYAYTWGSSRGFLSVGTLPMRTQEQQYASYITSVYTHVSERCHVSALQSAPQIQSRLPPWLSWLKQRRIKGKKPRLIS